MSRDLPRVRTPSRRALRSPTSARGRGYGDEDPEEEFPVTPEDAAELARIEAEEAKDREADEQNIAAYERAAERRKAQTRFAAFFESLEAPVEWFNDVYDNPNALMVFPPERPPDARARAFAPTPPSRESSSRASSSTASTSASLYLRRSSTPAWTRSSPRR